MEDRVKCILFLLGEEADSFAKRAEMYYKRRPEVIGSVEEAYRAYRALAERYDHISGELHKANHTIATAFPDQVQYALLEEDDDNLPKAFTTVDPRKIHKSTVEGLMKKKHGGKSGLKDGNKKSATPINKENAQAEIGRLQKEILVLQTEKEFIKSSYESGISKYWDLEKKINDMQEEVCYFQEEFNESAAIDDDEARALMTATALKSCEDALIKMQEQQKTSFSQAMIESQRIKVSREKLEGVMKGHGKSPSYPGNSPHENVKSYASVKIDELYSMKQKKIELQDIVNKIKGYFQMNSDLHVVEIAEKIDEIVNRVVDLELMVSAQTAKINRLCLENNELENSMQKLEEEKAVLTSGPGELNDKLKQAEEEFIIVQNFERSYHEEERIIYSNFMETINSFCDISHMLQSPLIEQQAVSGSMLTDEAAASHTDQSSEHGKTSPSEDPEMDEAARNPHVDVPDHSNTPETAILSDDSQLSSVYHEIKAEKHCHGDNTKDLCCCGLEDKSSYAAASVTVGTTENVAIYSSDDNKYGEPEHVHEIASNTKSSVQPYTIHSHEGGSLEQLHHTSPSGPGENVKQEDIKQDYATPCNSISEDNSKPNMKMNKTEESYITKSPTPNNVKVDNFGDQEDSMIKLQQLLMNGLQDKEKVLLAEYTSILRNYKNAKQKLTEVETKNQECLNEMTAMTSELRCANAMKDAEIQSLREILSSFTYKDASQSGQRMNSTMSLSEKNRMVRGHRRAPSFLHVHQRAQSASSISRIFKDSSSPKNKLSTRSPKEAEASHDAVTSPESVILEELQSKKFVEMENASPLEEKFRRDIDVLMEENLAFLIKFSMSFQQIQGFQTKYDQLKPEIVKLMDEDKLKSIKDGANDHSAKFETEATEKRLRELKIELQVWLEQNAMFKGELQCRFDSLCGIQAEIEGTMEMDADTEEGVRFTSYQAVKFQGEVSNMKQVNKKVADELQAGLDHMKELQAEIENVMAKILKSTSLSGPKAGSTWRNTPSKSRVPLRMFLFPAKKKKPSLFACVHPAFQKQHSDMAFFAKMK
ncbi:protein NETWORKED 2A-like [Phragmites australis]|uniref:protein NETWORKED 2A-like n=1 Tax=Phragmites australis TaxID=29695 RepID=UPI002D774E52|nr:protein NETWORKED 2A-like [Phragmites australis]